ncbi:hypothetical protein GCM10010358_45180 [Streptomyces minutiscleroticus]|uniref:Uncharacterized protein n=1 Tax=Streptomyces minutiscleroticus TaxID=68238 RepID=A0A918NPK1_9ACTN|nr:hypothetical protein GCM10010358_45180 [Streptomyces minutiscleroticus]
MSAPGSAAGGPVNTVRVGDGSAVVSGSGPGSADVVRTPRKVFWPSSARRPASRAVPSSAGLCEMVSVRTACPGRGRAAVSGTRRRSCATGTVRPSRVVTAGSPAGRAGPFPRSASSPVAGRTTIRPGGGGVTEGVDAGVSGAVGGGGGVPPSPGPRPPPETCPPVPPVPAVSPRSDSRCRSVAGSAQGRDRVASLLAAGSAVVAGFGPVPSPCTAGAVPGSTFEDVVVTGAGAVATGSLPVFTVLSVCTALSVFTVLSVAGRSAGDGAGPRASASGSRTSAPGNAVSAASVPLVVSVAPSGVAAGGGPASGRTRTGAPGPSRVSSTAARTGRFVPSDATGGPSTTARSVPAPSSSSAASGDPSAGGGVSETTTVSGGACVDAGFPAGAGPAFTSRTPALSPRPSTLPRPSPVPVSAYELVVLTFGGAAVVSAAGAGAFSDGSEATPVPDEPTVSGEETVAGGVTVSEEVAVSGEAAVPEEGSVSGECEVCGEPSAVVCEPSTGAVPSEARVPWDGVEEGVWVFPEAGTPVGRPPVPVPVFVFVPVPVPVPVPGAVEVLGAAVEVFDALETMGPPVP